MFHRFSLLFFLTSMIAKCRIQIQQIGYSVAGLWQVLLISHGLGKLPDLAVNKVYLHSGSRSSVSTYTIIFLTGALSVVVNVWPFRRSNFASASSNLSRNSAIEVHENEALEYFWQKKAVMSTKWLWVLPFFSRWFPGSRIHPEELFSFRPRWYGLEEPCQCYHIATRRRKINISPW